MDYSIKINIIHTHTRTEGLINRQYTVGDT